MGREALIFPYFCAMERSAVAEKLVEIVRPYVPEPELLTQLDEGSDFLKDLKINSAHMIDVVLDVEEAFDIEISDEAAESLQTVGQAIDLILSQAGASSGH